MRRNKNKYPTWDFVPTAEYYDDIYGLTYALAKSKKDTQESKKVIKRKNSAEVKTKNTNDNFSLERIKSQQIPDMDSFAESNTMQKAPRIIQKNLNQYHNFDNEPTQTTQKIKYTQTVTTSETPDYNNFVNTNVTSNLTSTTMTTSSAPYIPKKIITKDKMKISSQFKTHPEGVTLTSDVKVVSNEKKIINVSEYRTNRIFQNENLKRNQIYYYSYGQKENFERLSKNPNLIVKGNHNCEK